MKKILQVLAQKPGATGSGVYFQALIGELKKRGYSQGAIAAMTHEEFDNLDRNAGISLYPVVFECENLPFPIAGMSDRMPYRSTKYSEMTQEMHRYWKSAFQRVVDKAIKEFNPDIIISHHLWLLSAYIKEWYPEIPMIAISHGTDLRQIVQSPRFSQQVIEGCSRIETIFALNPFQQNQIHNLYGIEMERIKVMGIGYNGDLFYPSQEKKTRDRVRLVYAGKISNAKGIPSLLRAFDIMEISQRVELILIGGGEGEEFHEIHKLAKTINKSIEFTGPLTQKKVAHYFRKSDVFILPSFYEGLPLVIMEALACGLKVVTSELPGVREWLGESIVLRDLISYVKLPRFEKIDQPLKEDLPSYERELAKTIEHMIKGLNKNKEKGINQEKLENIKQWSWERLFERMEKFI